MEETEVQRIWKEYFEDLYNIALMKFREETISESRLGELRLR